MLPAESFVKQLLRIFLIGFFTLLLGGSLLLFISGETFFTAVSLAVSAVCGCPLLYADGLAGLSFFSQTTVAVLMQLSALLFMWIGGSLISIYHGQFDLWKNLRRAVFFTILIELLAIVGLNILWNAEMVFHSPLEKVGHSIFMAISAFTHSGFTLITGGFNGIALQQAFLIQLVCIPVIFAGSLSSFVIFDMYSIKKLRERLMNPQLKREAITRVSLFAAVGLLLTGAILFYLLPNQPVASTDKAVVKGIYSLFQSVSWRSAGFCLIAPEVLGSNLLLLAVITIFMFIGSSFAAAGGGITTLMVWVLLAKRYSVQMSSALLHTAKSVVYYALLCILSATLLLWVMKPGTFVGVHFFTAVSAFSGTGISALVQSDYTIIYSMVCLLLMLAGKPLLLFITCRCALKNKLFTLPA
jgi:trk system potassium uptake protein TrkH